MQNYNEILQGYNDRLFGILNQVTQIPSSQEKSLEITENGQVEIIPDDGHVLTKVIANVSVASSGGESGENKLAKVVDRSVTEITAEDLEGVTQIGTYAFYTCRMLQKVTIPNSVTSISERAFASCSNLTSIEIPASVTKIDTYAFYSCRGLTSITIEAETAPTLSNVNAFTNVPTNCIFYVHNVAQYQAATNWSTLTDTYTFVEIEEQ